MAVVYVVPHYSGGWGAFTKHIGCALKSFPTVAPSQILAGTFQLKSTLLLLAASTAAVREQHRFYLALLRDSLVLILTRLHWDGFDEVGVVIDGRGTGYLFRL